MTPRFIRLFPHLSRFSKLSAGEPDRIGRMRPYDTHLVKSSCLYYRVSLLRVCSAFEGVMKVFQKLRGHKIKLTTRGVTKSNKPLEGSRNFTVKYEGSRKFYGVEKIPSNPGKPSICDRSLNRWIVLIAERSIETFESAKSRSLRALRAKNNLRGKP